MTSSYNFLLFKVKTLVLTCRKKTALYLKTKITLVAALAFFGFFSLQCKKKNNLDELGLPKATQTGRNIFACRVNGENWISMQESRFLSATFNDQKIGIKGGKENGDGSDEYFNIVIDNPGSEREFNLDGQNGRFAKYFSSKNCFTNLLPGNIYGESYATEGKVTITNINKESKFISGTFSFDVSTEKCGNLKVTDGRFDLRYY